MKQVNFRDFLILLKQAVNHEKLSVYYLAVSILADLGTTKKVIFHPVPMMMKCLLPKKRTKAETSDKQTEGVMASLELLGFMVEQKLPWNHHMSQLLNENKGMTSIINCLKSSFEWQVAQASKVVYYMIANKQLIPEVKVLNNIVNLRLV